MSTNIIEQYIKSGNSHSLDLLLRDQPELLQQPTSYMISPLLMACYASKTAIVQVMLRHTKGITIHEACALGLISQVEAMIQQIPGIVNELSTHGLTPLAVAVQFGKEAIVKLLLSKKANPNIPSQDKFHIYPLHTAVQGHFDQITKILIQAGAQVNVQQKNLNTPLHLAAYNGHIDFIILLLEQGANVGLKNELQQTAADIALEKGHQDIAYILAP